MQAVFIQRRAGCARASRYAIRRYTRGEFRKEPQHIGIKARRQPSNTTPGPSVVDRLFPSGRTTLDRQQAARQREIPRIPLRSSPFLRHAPRDTTSNHANPEDLKQSTYPALDDLDGPAPVLKLEAVSKNLTITDFRRIIPQGKHIEGWTLQNGDILRVIPGRQLDTLTPRTLYFLIFASATSAHAYLEHAKTIHELAKQYTPDSLHAGSQLLPPGITAMGMDVASVVQAYTLLSPDSRMFMRQLNYPLSTWTKLFVQDGGLPWVKRRPDRSPFELRLTLDGSEASVLKLRRAFRASSEDRALPWSGGPNHDINITKWDYESTREPLSTSTNSLAGFDAGEEQTKPRPDDIYILGFETAHAARSFRAYWHRRRLGEYGDPSWGDEDPPLLNLDFLW